MNGCQFLGALAASAAAISCGGILGIDELGPEDAGAPDATAHDVGAPDALADALEQETSDAASDDVDSADAFDATGPESCFPVPADVVSWWRADGNGVDSIGKNNGALTAVTYVPGVVGQAFHFVGTGYVIAPAVGLPIGGANRTVEAWVRFSAAYDSPSRAEGLFLGYGGWGNRDAVYDLCVVGTFPNESDVLVWSQWGQALKGTAMSETAWHHVAATLASGTITLYLDGFVASQATNGYFVNTASDASVVAMGGLPASLANGTVAPFLIGDVDESAVYSRALAAEEIQGIFNAGSFGKCP